MTTNKNQSVSAIVNRARPEILAMKGYSSARSLQKGVGHLFFLMPMNALMNRLSGQMILHATQPSNL